MKRYLILVASVVLLVCMGTQQAWSVFVGPLRKEFGLSVFDTQLVFNTCVLFFCVMIIPAGRLHDRLGPRPLMVVSAAMMGAAYLLAAFLGSSYFFLWLALGVLQGTAAAVGYVCPIATAVKWFPKSRGLISGVAAAGYAGGPILLSAITETLYARGWHVLDVFGFVGLAYAPAILLLGLCLSAPPGKPGEPGVAEAAAFRRLHLFRDRRFWTLFIGMLCGTLPFLVLMGSAKEMARAFGIGEAALFCIGVAAAGNAVGRVFWGAAADRVGSRRSMLLALSLLAALVLVLALLGRLHPAVFLAAAFGIGFCYGSNFAIYPSAVSHLYGTTSSAPSTRSSWSRRGSPRSPRASTASSSTSREATCRD